MRNYGDRNKYIVRNSFELTIKRCYTKAFRIRFKNYRRLRSKTVVFIQRLCNDFMKIRPKFFQIFFYFFDFRWWFQGVGRVSEVVQCLRCVRGVRIFVDQVGISSGFFRFLMVVSSSGKIVRDSSRSRFQIFHQGYSHWSSRLIVRSSRSKAREKNA